MKNFDEIKMQGRTIKITHPQLQVKLVLYKFTFVLLDTGAKDSILDWTAGRIPEL
jgi:hypothetical protein